MRDINIDHKEEHLRSSDFITDIVIGMSDGLTVPFALAAGLKGAVKVTLIGITAAAAAFLVAKAFNNLF